MIYEQENWQETEKQESEGKEYRSKKKINNRKMKKEEGKGTMDAIFLLDVKKIRPVIEWKEYFLKSFLIY